MNIHDFEAPPLPDTWAEILELIFDRQRDLMTVYQKIEMLPKAPISVHTATGQRVLRDFAWRTTEELAESYEAFAASHEEHQYEELADSTHFLIELMIFAGVTPVQCLGKTPKFPELFPTHPSDAYWDATFKLGIAMNFLRNKPWKQSQVPTDERRFREALMVAFETHLKVWASCGLGSSALYGFYFRKSEVNKFRQRSEY